MNVEDETVRSLLKRPPVLVHPDATLRAVAETLAEESIGAVVVRGTRPPGAPGSRAEGVVSERDLAQALADGLDPDTTRAEDVMTMNLACAAPDESVLTVATRMLDNEIRHMPVTENGVLIGVVSSATRCTPSSTSGTTHGRAHHRSGGLNADVEHHDDAGNRREAVGALVAGVGSRLRARREPVGRFGRTG
jgi:CBS domain-containing protein